MKPVGWGREVGRGEGRRRGEVCRWPDGWRQLIQFNYLTAADVFAADLFKLAEATRAIDLRNGRRSRNDTPLCFRSNVTPPFSWGEGGNWRPLCPEFFFRRFRDIFLGANPSHCRETARLKSDTEGGEGGGKDDVITIIVISRSSRSI